MLLVGGENLVDFIQCPISLNYRAIPGGSPYNTALALGRLGQTVGYMTPISNDSLGDLLSHHLYDNGVNLLASRVSAPTSLAVVSLHGGLPSYQFYRQKTAERLVTKKQLCALVPYSAKGFHIGSLALTGEEDAEAWADMCQILKTRGLFISCDPNIRANFITDRLAYLQRLNRVLAHCDLIKLSDEDLFWINGSDNFNIKIAGRNLFEKSSAGLAIVTMGSGGVLGFGMNFTLSLPAVLVKNLVDTVGAGDTFMACILANIASHNALNKQSLIDLDIQSIQKLLTLASCAATINCERAGCNPPNFSEVMLRYKNLRL